ncbi:MAG: TIGR00730 family Rossman fold protein [Rhodospirillales bacterium]|nr:TIGR00730 family Rossman fold protein [Rhodospirillales bacterium]MCB9965872.1 TIGR00730 family Rossman fold protein [Rhodospirillales bacterium]MCB9973367.1 TIGR00730 family Rossman fold protein [Rhodospirillales bacterium]
MSMSKTVCVYCGSSSRVDDKFKQMAQDVGAALAKAGYRVVYGGGQVGLMGLVASSALDAGGEVVGIIPDHLDEREQRHEGLTELHVVSSMHERKAMMAERADIFLILPGGLGTMDEFFEIVTWRQLGLHNKPIIVYNFDGYWENLKLLLNTICAEGFMKPEHQKHYRILDTFTDIMSDIEGTVPTTERFKEELI